MTASTLRSSSEQLTRSRSRRRTSGSYSDAELRVRYSSLAEDSAASGTARGVGQHLGPVTGRTVLDLGCGRGYYAVLAALEGAERVVGVDASPRDLDVARRRARLHGVQHRCTFHLGVIEELPFGAASFDVALGKAVLHHVDVIRARPAIKRVLRPGARAAFAEPLGTNPALRLARDHVPYPGKNPLSERRALTRADLREWIDGGGAGEPPWREAAVHAIGLTATLERVLALGPQPRLRELDDHLLERWPALWPLCRYVVLTFVR